MFAIGNLAGYLVAGAAPRPSSTTMRVIVVGVFTAFGATIASLGLLTHLWLDAGLLIALGVGNGYLAISLFTWVQARTPRTCSGGTMSLVTFSSIGLVSISQAAAGAFARWDLDGLFLISGGLVLAVIAWIATQPGLRAFTDSITVGGLAARQGDTVMTPPTDRSVIIEHLTKRYGDHTVVDDLSFSVAPGRVTGFLGPNGSGKSTTMKMMLDLASADRGRATIGGQRYRDLDDPARTVGAMIESDAFHPGRSGRNHLRVLADATGIPHHRVDEVLEEVGLADAARRNAGAVLARDAATTRTRRCALGEPPVLILDEPGNGLDPEGIRTLRDRLRAQAANGGTVFGVEPSSRRSRAPRR